MCTGDDCSNAASSGALSPLEMVRAGLAGLAAADVVGLADQQVHDEVVALLGCVNQLDGVLAERIGSFDLRDLSEADAVRSTLSWLRVFGRMSESAASGWLGRARLLRELPLVAAAAKAGAVSVEHLAPVRRLVKEIGIAAVAEFDEALATVAGGGDPRQVGVACERIHAYVDPDGRPPDPAAEFERRELSLRPVGSMLHLQGRLDPEGGAALTAAIDALMRPPGPEEERTATQRRADALVDLARGSIGTGDLPSVGGLAPCVAILITPQTLIGPTTAGAPTDAALAPSAASLSTADSHPTAGAAADRHATRGPTRAPGGRRDTGDRPGTPHADGDGDGAGGGDLLTRRGVPALAQSPWLNWMGEIPAETARRIACDSIVWRIVMDPGRGLPLNVGRAYRIVPHWMRKALHARDRTCRWPGCDVPAAWCDAHHEIPWANGGPTAIEHLVNLCRYHHVLAHEGEWRINLDHSSGDVSIRRPDGRPYELGPSQPWTGTSRHGHPTQRPPQPRPPTCPASRTWLKILWLNVGRFGSWAWA